MAFPHPAAAFALPLFFAFLPFVFLLASGPAWPAPFLPSAAAAFFSFLALFAFLPFAAFAPLGLRLALFASFLDMRSLPPSEGTFNQEASVLRRTEAAPPCARSRFVTPGAPRPLRERERWKLGREKAFERSSQEDAMAKGSKRERSRQPRRPLHLELASASELKRQTFYALENPKRGTPLARFIGSFLFVLIVANAIVVFVSSQPGLDPIAANVIAVFYTFSTVCFLLEYIARIWIADLAFGDCTRARARLKYIVSPLGIIDLLSFAPNVVAWFVPMTASLRTIVNVIRLVRIVKISRYMRGLRTIGRVLAKRRHEIVASFLVLALLIVVSSVVMYEIENPAQPDRFDNLLSGVYWAVTTITATGYGDLVPITPAGRIVGSIIMFLSVALVAIPGGIFSAGFVAEFQNANYRRIERDIKSNSREHREGKDAERAATEDASTGATGPESANEHPEGAS